MYEPGILLGSLYRHFLYAITHGIPPGPSDISGRVAAYRRSAYHVFLTGQSLGSPHCLPSGMPQSASLRRSLTGFSFCCSRIGTRRHTAGLVSVAICFSCQEVMVFLLPGCYTACDELYNSPAPLNYAMKIFRVLMLPVQ